VDSIYRHIANDDGFGIAEAVSAQGVGAVADGLRGGAGGSGEVWEAAAGVFHGGMVRAM
jgi:hypothetical protein